MVGGRHAVMSLPGAEFNIDLPHRQGFFYTIIKKLQKLMMQQDFPQEILSPLGMKELGARLADALRPGDVLALVGDVGAGKTHLTQGLAEALGHCGAVTSPTFALVNEYKDCKPELIHFDWYRLEREEELLAIGWEEYLERDAILVVEWADRFPALVPSGAHCLYIEHLPTGRLVSYARTAGVE